MIVELSETYKRDGIHATICGLKTARVTIKPLPPSPTCTATERYQITTVRKHLGRPLLGSTRHTIRYSYNQALEYAFGYAGRIAKQKEERDA